MGRTRQDAPLPSIGNMSPADAPHLVFLQDPVAQVSYTLNMTEKTAMKGPSFSSTMTFVSASGAGVGTGAAITRTIAGPAISGAVPPLPATLQRVAIADEGQAQTEDLGSKTMEGVTVTGTRTTRTIRRARSAMTEPLSIVTEVWTSPELKTVVYSKRSDPRMGDQTFQAHQHRASGARSVAVRGAGGFQSCRGRGADPLWAGGQNLGAAAVTGARVGS